MENLDHINRDAVLWEKLSTPSFVSLIATIPIAELCLQLSVNPFVSQNPFLTKKQSRNINRLSTVCTLCVCCSLLMSKRCMLWYQQADMDYFKTHSLSPDSHLLGLSTDRITALLLEKKEPASSFFYSLVVWPHTVIFMHFNLI